MPVKKNDEKLKDQGTCNIKFPQSIVKIDDDYWAASKIEGMNILKNTIVISINSYSYNYEFKEPKDAQKIFKYIYSNWKMALEKQ